MKFRQLIILVSTAIFVASAAAQAHADSTLPPNCSTGPSKTAYNSGKKQGVKLVLAGWAPINNCDQVEHFVDVVADDVSHYLLPAPMNGIPVSNNVICRYTGMVDGVYDQLDVLYNTCSDQCFLDGQFAGNMAAEVYCELSIALGGLGNVDQFLRGPVQVCGFNFEVGCDSQFISTTTAYISDPRCTKYTQDPFTAIWDQARNNQCAYDPLPPPPVNQTADTSESQP